MMVAATAGVSVRYANPLLTQEGTSIVRLVQSRRLDRCHRALKDPLQAHRTVTEIASSRGFSDMTYFGRRFKAAYGILPSELRILAACPASVPRHLAWGPLEVSLRSSFGASSS
jgi:AraC-like DNA-binding protein